MKNFKVIRYFPALMLVGRRVCLVLGTLIALLGLVILSIGVVVNVSSDPTAMSMGVDSFLGWRNVVSQGAFLGVGTILLFLGADLFEKLRRFGMQIVRGKLHSPESVVLLEKLGSRSLQVFAFEVVALLGHHFVLPVEEVVEESSRWDFVFDAIAFFPALGGGSLVIGALLFYTLRDSIVVTLELKSEMDLTV